MCFDEELKNRKKKQEYLTTWRENYNQAGKCLPLVEKWIEQGQWEIDALSNAPTESRAIDNEEMLDIFQVDYQNLQTVLPMMPEYNLGNISFTDGSTTTSSSVVFSIVMDTGSVPTDENKKYSALYTTKYHDIQSKYQMLEVIGQKLLEYNFTTSSERFETAYQTFAHYKSGTVNRTAAAMEIRTFLDGLKGDLFQQVRKWEKENMTWEEMGKRIAGGDETSEKYEIMKIQGKMRIKLISQLSKVGKDREGNTFYKLEDIWSQTLNHTYSILMLLSLSYS